MDLRKEKMGMFPLDLMNKIDENVSFESEEKMGKFLRDLRKE